jgi:hypothetical protein
MKRRFLLLGIGIGIICTTLTFNFFAGTEVIGAASPVSPQVVASEITAQDVEKWLAERKLIKVEQVQWEAQQQQLAQLQQLQSTAPSPQQQLLKTSIYINSGARSSDVERMLIEVGLLEEDNSFQEQLQTRNLIRKIKPGGFRFEGTPTIEEIIAAITNQ